MTANKYLHSYIARGQEYFYFRPPPHLGLKQIRLRGSRQEAISQLHDILESLRLTGGKLYCFSKRAKAELNKVYANAKHRAGKRGLEFDLTFRDVCDLYAKQEGKCAVSGTQFSSENPTGAFRAPRKPSLDRIDNALGYTRKNCRLVCCMVNYAMNEWGEENLSVIMGPKADKVASNAAD